MCCIIAQFAKQKGICRSRCHCNRAVKDGKRFAFSPQPAQNECPGSQIRLVGVQFTGKAVKL